MSHQVLPEAVESTLTVANLQSPQWFSIDGGGGNVVLQDLVLLADQTIQFTNCKSVNVSAHQGSSMLGLKLDVPYTLTLEDQGGAFQVIYGGTSLGPSHFPTAVTTIVIDSASPLTSIVLPSFNQAGYLQQFTCTYVTSLVDVSFVVGDFGVVDFGQYITNISFQGCALNQASVDAVLLACVSGNSFSATLDLSGSLMAAPSSPTGTDAVTTLSSRGWTVSTS